MFVLSRFCSLRGLPIGLFRVSSAAGALWPPAGTLIKALNQVIMGCDIGIGAQIGPGLKLPHAVGVVIHTDARIGARFTMHSGALVGAIPEGAPVIGDDVNIAPGAKVIGVVVIGNRVRIGANSVLTHTIPGDDIVIAGVPGRVLRNATPDDDRETASITR
jgi:serine O-acetyltransferase